MPALLSRLPWSRYPAFYLLEATEENDGKSSVRIANIPVEFPTEESVRVGYRTWLWREAPDTVMTDSVERSVIIYMLQACHKMPTCKNESGRSLWDAEGMMTAMASALAPEMNSRQTASLFNLRRISFKTISKIREGGVFQIPSKLSTFERTFTVRNLRTR
jgi:hypothetical protein